MKKAVKAGIIGAGALGYSIIPTYLMKYHWIIRDKKMAKKEEKVLYLTFDDGPDTVYTNKLLDLLDQEQVPATFFMVAEAAQGHPDIVKRMKNTFFESSKCNAVRTLKDEKGSERIREDYGKNGN